MNIEELEKCALQWAEENEWNRAVMLITIEKGKTDDDKDNYVSKITSLVNGNGGLCSSALKQVLTDKRKNNAFREIYQRTKANILFEKMLEGMK